MRHVLEHNAEWRDVLTNALGSFTRRMVLVIFTPLVDETRCIDVDRWTRIPTISFRKQDITEMLGHLSYREEAIATDTEYKIEHVFYIEK
jgi:hypothetical protein